MSMYFSNADDSDSSSIRFETISQQPVEIEYLKKEFGPLEEIAQNAFENQSTRDTTKEDVLLFSNVSESNSTNCGNQSPNDEQLKQFFESKSKIDMNMNESELYCKKKKCKYFTIEKVPKGNSKKYNALIRIKTHFYSFLIELTNDYRKNKLHVNYLKFRNIERSEIEKIDIKTNKAILNWSLQKLLKSKPIRKRYHNVEKKQNKINLSKIKNKLSTLIGMKIKVLFNKVFLSDNIQMLKEEYGLEKAIPFYQFIEQLKEKKKHSDEYIKYIIDIGNNYVNYFEKTKPRKRKAKIIE